MSRGVIQGGKLPVLNVNAKFFFQYKMIEKMPRTVKLPNDSDCQTPSKNATFDLYGSENASWQRRSRVGGDSVVTWCGHVPVMSANIGCARR